MEQTASRFAYDLLETAWGPSLDATRSAKDTIDWDRFYLHEVHNDIKTKAFSRPEYVIAALIFFEIVNIDAIEFFDYIGETDKVKNYGSGNVYYERLYQQLDEILVTIYSIINENNTSLTRAKINY